MSRTFKALVAAIAISGALGATWRLTGGSAVISYALMTLAAGLAPFAVWQTIREDHRSDHLARHRPTAALVADEPSQDALVRAGYIPAPADSHDTEPITVERVYGDLRDAGHAEAGPLLATVACLALGGALARGLMAVFG